MRSLPLIFRFDNSTSPLLVFSLASYETSSKNELYAVEDLANAGSILAAPRYVSHAEGSMCAASPQTGTYLDCPMWSVDGRYIAFDWVKNQTEKTIDLYDTIAKKSYIYRFSLPYNWLKEASVAVVIDEKHVVISCELERDSRIYFYLVNLDANTYQEISPKVPYTMFLQ